MARPKPLAQGELLTHRDEINNHKHCNGNNEIYDNSLTMSPIGDEIYYYKWWNMHMVVEKGFEIGSRSIPLAALRCCVMWVAEGVFLLPEASLYMGPFMKVVLFDLEVSVETIRSEF